MIDANANTVYTNSYMANMLGYTSVEMHGKHLFFFMDEPAIESAKKYLKRRSEGIKENHTFEFTHKNGDKVFTTINTYPLLDDNGKYNGALATITDVTQSKKLEDISKQLETKFKSIFDSASIGLAILDKNLQIMDANKRLCEKLECSKDEILNTNILTILAPDHKNEVAENLANLLNGSISTFNSEYKFLRRNGFGGIGIVNFFVFTEGQNGEQKIVFSLRDITDIKNLEDELYNKDALFKEVLEHSTAAITIWDRELRNLYANPKAFEQVGRKKEIVPPRRHLSEGLPNLPGFYKKWEKRLIECFESGISQHYMDEDIIGGKVIFSDSHTNPVQTRNGQVFAVAIIFRDVTERKKIEQELIANEKHITLGKMAAYLSHEIRSPLAAISMNLDLLNQSLKLDEKQKRSFTLIDTEIKRLNNLLKEILGFSREFNLNKVDFDIRGTLHNISELLKHHFKEKNINFIIRVDSQIIHGDADKIEAVLIDIIKNSIDAINYNGIIEIYSQLNSTNKIFELFIKDTGCGVENSSKLFDPFYTTKTKGTGLGLLIAKNIIEKHGGAINLISSKPGRTIFQIQLPLLDEQIKL